MTNGLQLQKTVEQAIIETLTNLEDGAGKP
jgi:hypothetical protein